MKKILIILLALVPLIGFAQTDYYWYKGEKIQLTQNPNLYYISSPDSINLVKANFGALARVSAVKNSGSIKGKEKEYWQIVDLTNISRSNTALTTKSVMDNLQSGKLYIAPVYEKGFENQHIGTSQYFYVQLKSEEDYPILEKEAKKLSCEIIEQVDFLPLWYRLKSPISSNGINMANAFYETSLFEEIDPGFMFDFRPKCTSESLFSQQWGLQNASGTDINICNAWNITKGSPSIKVAVIDQGIDFTNKEFNGLTNGSFYDLHERREAFRLYGDHGTHVGGIIGAKHNNSQIAGVAPGVSLLSLSHKLEISPTISQELAIGLMYAAMSSGAQVINNSWGDHAGRFQELHSGVLENAIKNVVEDGRGNLGTVVVFAAGNYNTSLDYPAYVHPGIVVVGSIDRNGKKSIFSSYGGLLNVMAPGGNILSTVRGNQLGYMSGTSMAAPHVAGIAALILSVNPRLTLQQLTDILEYTAKPIEEYNSWGANRPNGMWCKETGYGLVDAYAAIQRTMGYSNYSTLSTLEISNRTISTPTNYNHSGNVNVRNVEVISGGQLNISTTGVTTINSPFTSSGTNSLRVGN